MSPQLLSLLKVANLSYKSITIIINGFKKWKRCKGEKTKEIEKAINILGKKKGTVF